MVHYHFAARKRTDTFSIYLLETCYTMPACRVQNASDCRIKDEKVYLHLSVLIMLVVVNKNLVKYSLGGCCCGTCLCLLFLILFCFGVNLLVSYRLCFNNINGSWSESSKVSLKSYCFSKVIWSGPVDKNITIRYMA